MNTITITTQAEAARAAQVIYSAEREVKLNAALKVALGEYAAENGSASATGKSIQLAAGQHIVEVKAKSKAVSYSKVLDALKAKHPELEAEIKRLTEEFTSYPEGWTTTIK